MDGQVAGWGLHVAKTHDTWGLLVDISEEDSEEEDLPTKYIYVISQNLANPLHALIEVWLMQKLQWRSINQEEQDQHDLRSRHRRLPEPKIFAVPPSL